MGLGQSCRGAMCACPRFRVKITAAVATTVIDAGEVLHASTLFHLLSTTTVKRRFVASLLNRVIK